MKLCREQRHDFFFGTRQTFLVPYKDFSVDLCTRYKEIISTLSDPKHGAKWRLLTRNNFI
uniref:Uncharacterized protein n=1 Tax=Romanomermis culicivorax TaxID=13658 RepID=A0A915ISV3_ROMCU